MGLDRAHDLVEALLRDGMVSTDDEFDVPVVDLDLKNGRIRAEIQYDKDTGKQVVVIQQGFSPVVSIADIEYIVFNDPATIVMFADGTKEVVKVTEGDTYQPEIGVAMALAKKLFGSRTQFKKYIKQFMKEEKEQEDLDPTYTTLKRGIEGLHNAFEQLGG